jgi:hypothetical protein
VDGDTPLQRLVRLVGEEPGVHAFIHRATADQGVVEEARALTRTLLQGQPLSLLCIELCRRHGVPEPLLRARLWAVASLFPGQSASGGDPYEILGVEPTADEDTIKSAFRRLCLQCHPDLNQDDPEAATRFQQLKAAYDMVSDTSASIGYGPPEGAGVWVESPCDEPRISNWKRMRHLLPLGLVVIFLVLAVGFADLLIQRPRSRSLARDAASVEGRQEKQGLSVADTGSREPLVLPRVATTKADPVVVEVAEPRVVPGSDMNAASASAAQADSLNDTAVSCAGTETRLDTVLAGHNIVAALDEARPPQETDARPLPSIRINGGSRPAESFDAVSVPKPQFPTTEEEQVRVLQSAPTVAKPAQSQEVLQSGSPPAVPAPQPESSVAKAPVPNPVTQTNALSVAKAQQSQAVPQSGSMSLAPAPQPESSVTKAPEPKPVIQAKVPSVDQAEQPSPVAPVSSEAAAGKPRTEKPVAGDVEDSGSGSIAESPAAPDTAVPEQTPVVGADMAAGNEAAGITDEGKNAKTIVARPVSDMLAAVAPVVDVAVVEKRLMRFLDDYAHDYSQRDLFAFMAHFTPLARENSKPVKTLLPAYQENFRTITAMDYRIEVDRWTIHDEGILFEGRFRLHGAYADGRTFSSNGCMSMDLVPSGDTYRVRNLSYTFR